jgi:predicted permease
MGWILQDLRFAFRQLLTNPVFAGVAVLTLGVGIGATTVIFSLTNALIFRSLPVDDPTTLVGFEELQEGSSPQAGLSYPYVQEYREGTRDVMRLAAHGINDVALSVEGEATAALGGFVTGDFFDVLGIQPATGRFLRPDEEIAGVPTPVTVISHGLWQRRFSGGPVIGETVRVNGQVLEIVGVAPADFHGLLTGLSVDLWMPIPLYTLLIPGSNIDHPTQSSWLFTVGRLHPGVGLAQAEAVTSAIARRIEPRWQNATVDGVQLSRLSGLMFDARQPVRLFMALLFGTGALVLMIACVNVTGMLLARATVRRREVGIRLAMGAGRGRLVGQLLTESTLLFILGGGVALVLATWVMDLLTAFLPSLPVPVSLDLSPDGTVVAFAIGVSLLAGTIAGLAPALQASRPDLVESLKSGSGGAAAGRSRLRSTLVVGQISLSLLLLVTAGLLTRSLQSALAVDTGFDPAGVMIAEIDLGPHGYDPETGALLFEQLKERLEARPEVQSVGYASGVPLSFSQSRITFQIPGVEVPAGASVQINTVDGDWFETVRMPIERGRAFDDTDRRDGPGVVIVNREMARRYWPDGEALGARIQFGSVSREIVGIAATGKYNSLQEDPLPFVFLPRSQSSSVSTTLHVRSAAGLGAVGALARRELQALDSNVPLVGPASLEERVTITLLPQRMGAALIGVFGAVGLLLAAVGLYGILAYSVSQRTREIGVRIALGARAENVLAMVIRQGVLLLAIGLALGLVLAFAATRLLAGLLVDVSPTDPLTFVTVALILAATTLFASYLPARRATRVDPMVALRAE